VKWEKTWGCVTGQDHDRLPWDFSLSGELWEGVMLIGYHQSCVKQVQGDLLYREHIPRPHWRPDTEDNIEPCEHYAFSYTYRPMRKLIYKLGTVSN
jgi:hypothetical protein